jgi:hypothetical protein
MHDGGEFLTDMKCDPPRQPGLEHELYHVGFVVDKSALGWIFRFLCHAFRRLVLSRHHSSSGTGKIRHLVTSVESLPIHLKKNAVKM